MTAPVLFCEEKEVLMIMTREQDWYNGTSVFLNDSSDKRWK